MIATCASLSIPSTPFPFTRFGFATLAGVRIIKRAIENEEKHAG